MFPCTWRLESDSVLNGFAACGLQSYCKQVANKARSICAERKRKAVEPDSWGFPESPETSLHPNTGGVSTAASTRAGRLRMFPCNHLLQQHDVKCSWSEATAAADGVIKVWMLGSSEVFTFVLCSSNSRIVSCWLCCFLLFVVLPVLPSSTP